MERVKIVENRLDVIDANGSRAVIVLEAQMKAVEKKLDSIDDQLERINERFNNLHNFLMLPRPASPAAPRQPLGSR
jgi:hypothetical protein